MSFNFDNSSFGLNQAGLELSLSDFAFDPAQATQVQQHLQQQQQQHQQQQQQQQQQHQQQQQQQQLQQQHQQKQLQQQEQRQLQNLLLHDDPSQNLSAENQTQRQQIMNNENPSTSSSYDFTPSMTADMMASISASASTTPLFQTHPDKIAKSNGANLKQQLQQQHRQQQLYLQQQQQRQQQQLLQQQHQQLQQFPQTQTQVSKEGTRQQLLTPAGSEYYTSDYTQYMSPLGIQPMTTSEVTVDVSDQFEEEEEVQFTPLISPAMTPSHPYSNVAVPMSTSNEIFSPLTSPALQPHRTSQIDYLSFSGPGFSSLPIQFQQAHQVQQQQIQQLQQLQSQAQVEPQQQQQQLQHQQLQLQHDQQKKLTNQLQQQLQRQHQLQQQRQGQGTKHALVDAKGPAQSSQRPPMKRRNTVERDGANGHQSTAHSRSASGASGGGPIRTALPKSSPAMRPMTSQPISPTSLRKQNASAPGRSRSSSTLAPLSPMVVQFPTSNGRPTPSPIMTGTSQSQALQSASLAHSQPSPSPLLVTNMNHLSMMPLSPAPFVLPASSMIPLKESPVILPMQQSQGQAQAPRQLRISQPVQVQQQQQQQLHAMQLQPQQSQSPPAAPQSVHTSQAPSSGALSTQANNTDVLMASDSQEDSTTPSSRTGTPKSALAPVTPASLMNLSGSESTPTSSPKFGANAKSKALLSSKSNQNGIKVAGKNIAAAGTKSGANLSSSSTSSSNSTPGNSGSSKRAVGRRHVSGAGTTAGPLAPRTPGTSAILAPMPPPSAGFSTLISPALKPTLMPQPSLHRGSISGQAVLVSPRVQPLLVSPSLKPWLPGVSTSEAMARLASKSNYQNILDGDHTALGLSYNTDLHSGIELRRTSHKAAEQKRRDSLKHCFEDLRQMIPNIVDKAPSKVFLLKKSFDHICELKSGLAKQNLLLARMQAQQEFFQQNLQEWMSTLPQDLLPQPNWEEAWKMTEEALDAATAKELQATRVAAEMAEQSALAVERARVGNPQSGAGKEGKNSTGTGGSGGAGNSHGQPSSGSDPTSTSSAAAANAAASEGNYRQDNGEHGDNRDEDDGDESEEENEMIRKSQPDASITERENGVSDRVIQSLSIQSTMDPSATNNRQKTTMPGEAHDQGSTTMRKAGGRRARSRSARSEQQDEAEEDEEEEKDDEDLEEGEGDEDEEYAEEVEGRSGVQDQEMTDVSDRPA
ncbi:hypothetical protein BGZ68_009772 [Mortierella alpina]|nr:hypothetical protein BGZ68_009772 [Mortierella alpina]